MLDDNLTPLKGLGREGKMKSWAIITKALGFVWLMLASLLILACTVMVGIKEGFIGVQRLLSPFNVLNYIVILITLAPGFGLLMLSEKLQRKTQV